jgi:HSP20 family protein
MAKSLVRWDPFQDMVTLREAMDRLFEESFVRPQRRWLAPEGATTLALDLFESDDDVTVRASIPGVKPEDIDISITGDVLTIKGEAGEEREEHEGNYHLRERRYGAFQRSLTLPTLVKTDKARAEFEHGVLTLTLPKVEEVKPKTITIKAK